MVCGAAPDNELFHLWTCAATHARCSVIGRGSIMAATWRSGHSDLRIAVVDVRRLRHSALIHGAFLGELARSLVPPDRAPLSLLFDEVRPLLQQLADEAGVFGFVMAAGEHHGVVREEDESQDDAILSSPVH